MNALERFRYRAAALDEDEAALIAEAAQQDPGEKLVRSLRWSSEWLLHYTEQLKDPDFRAAEDERALAKGSLLAIWQSAHPPSR